MNQRELTHLLVAFLILSLVIAMPSVFSQNLQGIGLAFIFSAIILLVNIGAKKLAARSLDADVEHELWHWQRYGFKPGAHFAKRIPAGAIFPLGLSLISLGLVKCMSILTYETTALKRRAARRFGFYSFTEMTDWHHALIGAAGIGAILTLSFASYWIPSAGELWQFAAYYAFWNMIPASRLDGSQIFFGSRVLWTALSLITIVFTAYALVFI